MDQTTGSKRIKYPEQFPKTAGFRPQKEHTSSAPAVSVFGRDTEKQNEIKSL